ncbi:unnamed protein product [Protopolystoma xenopodis]|uniref:Uncharacterized protein n=1 Tax=Protopolystoma xenopodis TaxID=117903 RepID=A0A3S5CQL1_9PLAT|nr:unnamed protein product [Protopolystoma xenopodis]
MPTIRRICTSSLLNRFVSSASKNFLRSASLVSYIQVILALNLTLLALEQEHKHTTGPTVAHFEEAKASGQLPHHFDLPPAARPSSSAHLNLPFSVPASGAPWLRVPESRENRPDRTDRAVGNRRIPPIADKAVARASSFEQSRLSYRRTNGSTRDLIRLYNCGDLTAVILPQPIGQAKTPALPTVHAGQQRKPKPGKSFAHVYNSLDQDSSETLRPLSPLSPPPLSLPPYSSLTDAIQSEPTAQVTVVSTEQARLLADLEEYLQEELIVKRNARMAEKIAFELKKAEQQRKSALVAM